MLRSGLPIAIAIFLGFHGYDAFVVGSALGIVAWSLVLYFSLSCAFKTKWQPFLFTFCLLFPTSFGFDSDFILGQQSHLANVILLLAALIFYVLNISSGYKRFLILSGCSFFIICVEEPIRAAFLLLTIIFISIICFDYKKYYLKLIVLFSFALLGSLCNKLLLHTHHLAVDISSSVTLIDYNAFLRNLSLVITEYFSNISSLNIYTGLPLKSVGFFSYICNFTYVTIFNIYIVINIIGVCKRLYIILTGRNKPQYEIWDIIKLAAFLGLIITILAICILNPDSSRHALWAIFIIKLCFLIDILKFLRGKLNFGEYISCFIMLSVILLSSTWVTIATLPESFRHNKSYNADNEQLSDFIYKMSAKYKVKNIYGNDFWQTMPLNVTIPGLKFAVLALSEKEYFSPMKFLMRPSYFEVSPKQKVLYYFRADDASKQFANAIKLKQGQLLGQVGDFQVWLGYPLWPIFNAQYGYYKWDGCQLLTQNEVHKKDCTLIKEVNHPSSYLSYGPYQELPAGTYKFSMRISSPMPAEQIIGEFDVVQGSKSILTKGALHGSNNDFVNVEGLFTVDGDYLPTNKLIEVRSFINKEFSASLKNISIEKIDNR